MNPIHRNHRMLGAFLFVLHFGVNAQQNVVDSLVDQIDTYLYSNTDSSLHYSQQLLQYGLQESDSFYVALAFDYLSSCYDYRGETEIALDYLRRAEAYYLDLGEYGMLGGLYMGFGNIYSEMGQLGQCLTYYHKAEDNFIEEGGERDFLALLYYNMGLTFMDLDDKVNQAKYVNKAAEIIEADSIDYLITPLLNAQADLAISKGDLKIATNLATRALQRAKEESDLLEQISAFQTLALASQNKENSIHLQDSALRIAKQYGDDIEIVNQQVALATYLLESGNKAQAHDLAAEVYAQSPALNSLLATKKASLVYARVMESKGQYKEALEAYTRYNQARDSLNAFAVSEKIFINENELAKQQNALLQTKAEVLEADNERSYVVMLSAVIGLLMSVVIIVLLVNSLRLRKRSLEALNQKQKQLDEQSRELQLKNEELNKMNKGKDKLFSIITHDLRQPFHQISSFIQILQHTPELDPSLKDLTDQMKDSTDQTLRAMENLLIWSKSQFVGTNTHIQKLKLESITRSITTELTAAISNKQLQLETLVSDELEILADRHHVEIIIRNLLSNAIKFSPQGGKIILCSKGENGKVTLSIKDEGRGMSPEEIDSLLNSKEHFSKPGTLNEKGTGLGMLIVTEFLRENQGSLSIESEPGKGSAFYIEFKSA